MPIPPVDAHVATVRRFSRFYTRRIGALIAMNKEARVTLAVDSDATVEAAVAGGVHDVIIDVNVGLPRCGCPRQSLSASPRALLRLANGIRLGRGSRP